jgi:hypothetical protein
MSEQRIPRADGNFAAYANHYYDAVKAWWDQQGLDGSDLKPLQNALSAWNAAYPKHVTAQNMAQAARETKDAAKRELERQIRPVSAFVQTYPRTTDAERAAIGISVRDAGGSPTPPPTARPAVFVDAADRLTHRLRITNADTTAGDLRAVPRSKRPKGTLGAEVYVAIVAPQEPAPQDMSAYRFVRTVTSGNADVTFESQQGGHRAAYLVRWISSTGEPGPWGQAALATIAA